MMKEKDVKKYSKLKIACITILTVSIILSAFFIYQSSTRKPQTFSFRAAIVDQLSGSFPNEDFIQTATNLLKNAGFKVEYYSYKHVTVNFYKQLLKENFGIIIFRVHSGMRSGENIVDFFTSEEIPDNDDLYRNERSLGYVVIGYIPLENKSYFAITPKLVSAEANLHNSIIIAMGCSSLRPGYESMAQAFISKGAKAYIGWSNSVTVNHSDNETIRFLQLFLQNKTISEATYACHPDPNILGSKLRYYPPEAKQLTFSALVADAKLSGQPSKLDITILALTIILLLSLLQSTISGKPHLQKTLFSLATLRFKHADSFSRTMFPNPI